MRARRSFRALAAARLTRLDRGLAAVEFAIMTTLLVPLLLGASEFGRAMYQYDTVVKGTRAAARYLSQYPPSTNHSQAKNLLVYGTMSPGTGAVPLVPGLTTAMVEVKDADSDVATHLRISRGPGTPILNFVSVSVVGLKFQTLAPSVLPEFTFDSISATMVQGPSL